jgi:hypothetical protein
MASLCDDKGSGGDALAGLDYQIDVSVWLALDLILANRLTDELELEPASEEDIEAVLAPNEVGAVVSAVRLSDQGKPYRLVVQAKLRSGDPWHVSDINALLEHGEKRDSAAKRLEDPDVRYLLVTSAALNGETKGLRTHVAGVWPTKAKLAATTAKLLPADALGRIAVLSNHEPDWVVLRIRYLLTDALRVPRALWEACLTALRTGARSRVRRQGTNRWIRAELQAVVEAHEGYLASSPELDDYVKPTNWEELLAQIQDRHAVLILGQSGTGKTLATDVLFHELSERIPGLKRVRITSTEALRQDQTPEPVLFDIEDPWGRYTAEEKGRDWTDQLSLFMAGARHNRIIVATSRLDVGQAAKALDSVKRWRFDLQAEHYGKRERHLLYANRVARLPLTALQQLAARNETRVLDQLTTPLEIQKYFDALRTIDPAELEKNTYGALSTAIAQAHEDSIESTVGLQIDARKEIKPAAVLWAMLVARPSLSLADVRAIEERLYDLDDSFERGITPLVNFFVAARNLRQKNDTVSYYHPRVEAGIIKALTAEPLPVRRTLSRLVDILIDLTVADDESGTAVAAEIVGAAKKEAELTFTVSQRAQAAIDAWLSATLAIPGRDLKPKLTLAAAIGSTDSVEGEIARWLLHRPRRRSFAFMMDWGPPQRDASWYARIKTAPATKPLIERFLREGLPFDRDHYSSKLAKELDKLASELTPAFIDAAREAVHFGVLRSADAISVGALRDIDAFEPVLNTAVEIDTPKPEDAVRQDIEWLAIENGEYSDAYLESFADNDDGYTAREFIEDYVRTVRRTRGWASLDGHRHRAAILSYWLRDLWQKETLAPDAAELAALLALANGTPKESDFWYVAARHWTPNLIDALTARIRGGAAIVKVRHSAMACLLCHVSDILPSIVSDLVAHDCKGRLADLAIEIARTPPAQDAEEGIAEQAWHDALAALPRLYAEIARAAVALDAGQAPTLSQVAQQAVQAIQPDSEEFRLFRMMLVAHGAPVNESDILWMLAHSDQKESAVLAVELAHAEGRTDIVEAALLHRFTDVMAKAMHIIADPLPAPLPQVILDRVEAKGHPVRTALVALMDAKPHAAHIPTLLTLVEDRFSNRDYHDNEESLPIARAAVAALAKVGPLSTSDAKRMLETALETYDFDLRRHILALLAIGSAEVQRHILSLALKKHPAGVRRAAVAALLAAEASLDPTVIAAITPERLLRQAAPIAAELTIILGWRGDAAQVQAAAEALSASASRRVFLVLLVAARRDRDAAEAERLAAHLPEDHVGRTWALGHDIGEVPDEVLNDLGDVWAVAEVLFYLKLPKNSES